jgi:hypothetical protein
MTAPMAETVMPASPRTAAVLNSFVLTAIAALIVIGEVLPGLAAEATVTVAAIPELRPLKFSTLQHGTPWDTFVLLALWAYCGVRVVMKLGNETSH